MSRCHRKGGIAEGNLALSAPQAPADASPDSLGISLFRRRLVFFAAACGYLLSQFYRSFLTVIHDDLVRDLGIGPSEFGALGSAWFFAFSLSQFPVGLALDKLGPRRTIAGMMLAAVAGALLFALAQNATVALIGMALIGVGCSPLLMGPSISSPRPSRQHDLRPWGAFSSPAA